ncbi:MAG: MBL fold metallo-hydrolase [bacterium]
MATITFHGAIGTVTGSQYLLEAEGMNVLVDCGMFQGSKENRLKNWEPFSIRPKEIDAVLLTHAHTDHVGLLPRLTKQGFTGPVYCTRATAELSRIMLLDSAHIQEEDARWANKKGFTKHKPALPLFTTRDAERSLHQFKPLHYGEQLDLTPTMRVKFKDAGHILGSSMIDLRVSNGKRRRKIVFSGDLGRPGRALLRDPVQIYDIDYLVLESTYGDRLHGDEDFHDELVRVINESIERGGVLIVPSFAVGRTQTLLYVLRHLQEANAVPVVPIYVDSPMGIRATEVYSKRIADQRLSVRLDFIQGDDIFTPRGLVICESRDESKAIMGFKGPGIIISSSGMVTAGRVLHHMIQRLPDKRNTVLFVGYQAHGTRGRRILDGEETVKIHGQFVPVKAHIENLSGFSGHADYNEIQAWLMGFDHAPEQTFIVHGEPEASQALSGHIKARYDWEITVPRLGDSHEIEL